MQCGFALFEAGAVRAKNVTNILLKNFLDALIGMIVYWAVGYAFAFGNTVVPGSDGNYTYHPTNSFIGNNHFFLSGSFYGEFFFNFVFAATATTITSGAIVERSQLSSYLIYSFFLTGFIQPVTVHWTWSTGFLLYPPSWFNLPENVYFRDYAGACSVHGVGGACALIACIFVGPRIGRFDANKKKYHIPGHSTPLTALGGFILIIGFLGMVMGHANNIELSAINMVLGGSASGLTAMFVKYSKPRLIFWERQMWSFLTLVDSTLCGMVALCAGCNIIETYGAFVIGVLAAFVYMGTEKLLHKFLIDDPLGSVATHLGGGLLGTLATPFFMVKKYSGLNGIFYWEGCPADIPSEDCPFYQWAWHIFGCTIMIAWTTFFCIILFGILWKLDLLRVDRDTEIRGIDIKVHGEPAYPEMAYGHGWDNDGEFSLQVMANDPEKNPFGANSETVKKLHGAASMKKDSMTQGGLIQMVLANHTKGL
ncbi:unnamed protein product [Oikopleura dioica]|uniref:Ammonium transporter AmtB-like domain-containing protein n=1 Tax=Oikopleura dioica TaxID=34765 RepID=E4YU42_OIKDI|nr:unnamed protein product [Oikopleura dioica]